jgi:hypothetical protein
MKKNFFDDDSFDFSDNGNNIQTNPDYSYNSSLGTVNEPLFNDNIEEILKQIFPSELPLEESKKEEHVQKSRNLFFSEYIPAPSQPISNTEEISRKRGRKQKTTDGTNSTKKKTHSGWDEDNTTRKIQIHFLNFIIFYLNDIIYGYTRQKNLFLRKFSHSAKRNVNSNYIETLKSSNIKQLLINLSVSPKYKKKVKENDENINKNTLNYLCCEYNWFNELIQAKFLDLFKLYFNQKRPLEEIYFKGKKITLSKDTKNFYALLKKHETHEKKLIERAEAVYFNN